MRRVVALSLSLVPAIALADETVESTSEPTFTIGGYVQPQARVRQDDDVAQFDENGFRFRRARLTLGAARTFGVVEYDVEVESELTPEFQLLDAFIRARSCLPGDGTWSVALGQIKAPV